MMDEFIHWPKPYLLLSPTCDEILSWMIEIWMKSNLVSDNDCNTVNLYNPPKNVYKEWQLLLGLYLVLVTLYRGVQLVVSMTIRIGVTKYHV